LAGKTQPGAQPLVPYSVAFVRLSHCSLPLTVDEGAGDGVRIVIE